MNESVQIWLDDFLDAKGKATIEELTAAEIRSEIEEVKGTIENEKLWRNKQNIIVLEEYLGVLNKMLADNEGVILKTYECKVCFGEGRWASGLYSVQAENEDMAIEMALQEIRTKLYSVLPELDIEVTVDLVED